MSLPKERRENLVRLIQMVTEEDILDEVEAMSIIRICMDACERAKGEIAEDMMMSRFQDGGGKVC